MKRISVISLGMLVLLACSAFAQDVRYNFDKTADFSKFKTYKWVTLKNAAPLDAITDKNIKTAVDQQLASKGLTRVESDQADLYVGIQAAVGQDKQFTSYSSGWGYGPGWYGAHWTDLVGLLLLARHQRSIRVNSQLTSTTQPITT